MKLHFLTVASAFIISMFVVSAQDNPGIKPGVIVGKDDPVKSDLQKATEAMVAKISTALKAFKEVNKPDNEKLKEFDTLIKQISDANKQVAEDGLLYKEIKVTIKRQLEKQKKWDAKARDPNTKAEYREDYKKLAQKEAENAKKIADLLIIIIDISEELDVKLIDLGKDKEYYKDMIEAEQTKKAAAVLDKVAISMVDVVTQIDKLRSPEFTEVLGLKPPVDKK